jgi:hypothetical protein
MKKLVFNLSILLLFTGCTKNFVEKNTNPTNYNGGNFDPNTLLTSAQLNSCSNRTEVWRGHLPFASVMIQLFSNTSTIWAGDKYLENVEYMNAYWPMAYDGQVRPVTEMLALTENKPQYKNLHQIGRLMRVWIFQRLTDIYGDVPYSEAGQGYNKGILYPKYDKQEDIYNNLLKEAEEATAALDPNGTKPSGDLVYKGDIVKWQHFGGTLMLKVAMRLVKINEAAAKAGAAKAIGKTMTGITENAFVKGSGGVAQVLLNNPNSQILLGDGGDERFYTKWSKTLIDLLRVTKDPRLSRIARVHIWTSDPKNPAETGNATGDTALQKGQPNGKNASSLNDGNSIFFDPSWSGPMTDLNGFNSYSSINTDMIQRDAPTYFLTYAESELLLAEAALRWGNAYGDAATHYDNGVKGAMTSLVQYKATLLIPDAELNDYLTTNPFSPAKGLEMINTQYWIAAGSTVNFYEAWINWRRSGFPVLVPVNYPGNATGATIPRRFVYPVTEASVNAANLNAAIGVLPGGDKMTSRVWWDK